MPLDKDNVSHRDFSSYLDSKYSGKAWYDNAARSIIHGTYHAGRYSISKNGEELARAKDQFSKFGSGQTQTEYLKAHRESQAKEAEKKASK